MIEDEKWKSKISPNNFFPNFHYHKSFFQMILGLLEQPDILLKKL